ncbi:MAG: outer membrane protein assembly factor BamE [Sulfuricaulis sp.]|nr:outer membrane protein assembly factor BamE [Sulfuricaulis sp.]
MKPLIVLLTAVMVALSAGCSYIPTIPGMTPYRMEIQQGNFVTQEMISRLKLGMTRDQVKFVLGTPLVADMFHGDRWDYVYARQPRGGGPVEQRRFALFFEDSKLKRVEGDVVPAGTPGQTGGGGP